MIDSWRGLAATGVVCYHLELKAPFDLGQLCVLAFFVISGYCIAANVESCRRKQIGLGTYLFRRLRRIYPPYFLSICYFLATRLLKLHLALGNQLSRSPIIWIQNLTMTQWLTLLRHPMPCAYLNPSLFVAGYWSLNYEEQFYLVMGLMMVVASARGRSLALSVVGLMIPALVWNLLHPAKFYGVFLEYWIAFAVGSLVYIRLCSLQTPRGRFTVDVGLLFLLLFALACHWNFIGVQTGSVYLIWAITSCFALCLIYLRPWDDRFKRTWLGRFLNRLGLISYSVYLTHQCNLSASLALANKLVHWGLPVQCVFGIRLVSILCAGALFWYFCERPFLNHGQRNKPAPA